MDGQRIPISKEKETLTTSLKKLDLNYNNSNYNNPYSIPSLNPKSPSFASSLQFSSRAEERKKKKRTEAPSLESLCLGVVGRNLEDVIHELSDIAVCFPSHIKMAIAAIARRRKLLSDDALVALVDSSWEILDISGSDVTDSGLVRVAEVCQLLRAVDISQCSNVTATGVSGLVKHCRSLQTLRCGGCPRSDYTARSCLSILKPKLNDVEEESWEELDTANIANGAESLRWLVWPKISMEFLATLAVECPRIIVNPKPSPFGFRGLEVPVEAYPDVALDGTVVKDIDPQTWAVSGFTPRPVPSAISSPGEMSMAEKFRLAFVERDTRLAPKRAKNARQHQRRAERELMMASTRAKAIALASRANKSLHTRN